MRIFGHVDNFHDKTIEEERDTYKMPKPTDSFLPPSEEDRRKFQRRNLLARMCGNILAGAAVKIHDHGGSADELATFAVDLAERVLDKLDKKE